MKRMIRIKPFLLILLFIIVIASCEGDNNNVIRTPEEEQILELAYDLGYNYPDGFCHEDVESGSVYYDNTLSITPLSEREYIWIELNTDDKNEARLWSDKTNENNSVNRDVVLENESEKYFQFKRVSPTNPRDILYSRVHKTSYFQPTLNKFSVSDTIVGKYNGELTLNNVKELVEYLWSCGTMDANYTKVITSELQEFGDRFESYVQSILIVYGDFGLHDEIEVYDNHIILGKAVRELFIKTKKTKTITGIKR
jgi:Mg2+ and Co2+ transporter CorA